MSAPDRHPLLYQINTRVTLAELSRTLPRKATLDDVPDAFLDEMRDRGFRWLWFLGVWQTGEAARAVSLANPALRAEYARELPDFRDEDVSGSPFAIKAYRVHADFGGDEALARLREKMSARGLKLLTDFVVNHCAPDNPWSASHPEYFIPGDEGDLAREPKNWGRVSLDGDGNGNAREAILAYGRDPYFPGWPDTLQLNYRHPRCREAMTGELLEIAKRCDGVRCDMAMLVQPDVFERTWGDRALPRDGVPAASGPFWPGAIAAVKAVRPDFLFIAEVYWDREWELQQAGFDFTYDKRLYDRLHAGSGQAVREHLLADPDFQNRSLRFLENHDEPRAADAFPDAPHRAAAVIGFFVPGLRFFHDGEFSGRRVHVSMHLGRRPEEPPRPEWEAFYADVLSCLRRREVHDGAWSLAQILPAWENNPTWNAFTAFAWRLDGGKTLLAVVNYSPGRGQCFVKFDMAGLGAGMLRLTDLLGEAEYVRSAVELAGKGMYFDMPAWGHHLFEVRA
ncbi:MAG TPA: alpha-amylase family glycosyl hydrolase [Fibrobacteria bacterium]|nr:alpha-amylase family glycosyl hydrolase [Fibrobacteria bacterium]